MSNLTNNNHASPPNEKIKNEGMISENITKGISFNDIYEVVSEDVQEGGMGQAILCKNKIDKQYYVLKTYLYEYSENKHIIDIFKKEIEFALKLEKYPYIVYSQTALKEKDKIYLVMELVGKQPKNEKDDWKAATLLQEIQEEINIEDSYKWAIEFCRGMQYLNSIGMKAHQDIKPSNILITEDRHIKISDFGLANIRNTGSGTEGYRSPEQARGEETDVRSDIYSFGVVLYEMFNGGVNPYNETKNDIQEEDFILKEYEIENPSKYCRQIIQKCGEKEAKDRYKDFKELEKDLLKEAKKEIGKDFEVEGLPIEQMNAKDYFDKGNGYQNIERYKEAIKNYNKAIELNPKYVFAYNNRGAIKANLNQYEEAIKDYNIAVKLDPNCVFAYYNIGNAKRSLKQYEEAIKYYQMAIKITPNAAYIYNSIGNTKGDLECYEEAIKYYDKAIEFNSKYAIAYYARGIVKEKLKKYKEALKDYDTAIKFQLDSQYAYTYHFYNNRGIIKANLNQHEEAIKDYSKAIDLEPKCVQSYYNRGISEKNLKKYKEAIKDFKEVLKCLDKDIDSICMIGNINLELGKYKEAINNYNRIIELNPKYAIAYNNRGNAKYYLKQYEEAIKDYDIAIKIDSKYVSAYSNHGNAKYKLKLYEEAIKDYNIVIKMDNKHISSYKNLIEIYKLLGKGKEAKEVEEKLNKIIKG